jgi:hypothetical protein
LGYRDCFRIYTCIVGELKMRNVFYCIKEMAIMFAMVVMVMAAAAGGTYLLLHTL